MPSIRGCALPFVSDASAEIKVLLIDRNRFALHGADRALQDCETGTFQTIVCHEFDRAVPLLRQQRPDVVVLAAVADSDLGLFPDVRQDDRPRLLVLVEGSDPRLVDQAVLAGARGILRCSDDPSLLPRAIQAVHGDEWWIERAALSRLVQHHRRVPTQDAATARIASLTERERAVVVAVVDIAGAPTAAVAERLNLSQHTLRNHLSRIYTKLDVANRTELYAYACRHGIAAQSRAADPLR